MRRKIVHPTTTALTGRQDKKDKSRAPISAKLVANMLSVAKQNKKSQIKTGVEKANN